MRKVKKVKKLCLFYCLTISLAVALSGCSEETKEKQKIEYYKQHPGEVQNAMLNCVKIVQNGGNIDHDADCIAIFKYEKQRCEMKQKEGALWYMQYNCNDKLQMGKLAALGM